MLNEFKPVLKSTKFLELWGSQILSQITINIMNFLFLTRLFNVTGSSIATSLLWIAYALPAIFFGPVGAVTVDLVSRKKMLMITNLLQALTIFLYIFSQDQTIFLLYCVVLAYSFFNQFYVPAESAYLPSAVDKKLLPQVNSLFFVTQQASLVIGFGVAGFMQEFLGFQGSLIICAVMMFLAFISTSFLPEIVVSKKIDWSFENTLKTLFNSIIEGYDFIKQNKGILFPLLLILGIQSGLAIITVNLPLIAHQILNIPVSFAGISIVVPAGIGAVLGSVYVSKMLKAKMRKKMLIEYSLAVVSFALLFIGIGVAFMPIILRVVTTSLLIILVGFGFVGISIPALTSLQENTPIGLRGRVLGNMYFLTTIITIFPVLFSGAISEIFGVRMLLSIIAVGLLLVFIYAKKIHTDNWT
jgi:MFS family permease